MRKILLLAVIAPLFAACAPGARSVPETVTGTMGEGRPNLPARGDGTNAGSGPVSVTGTMGEGRPTIEPARAAPGRGIGASGTPIVTGTMGDGRPTIERR